MTSATLPSTVLYSNINMASPVCMPSTLLSTLTVSNKIIDTTGHLDAFDSEIERCRSEARDVCNKPGSLIVEAGGDRDIDAEQRIRDVGSLPPSLIGMRGLSILGRGYQRPPHVSTFLASDSETRQADT
jgi:hypothetical protein